MKHGHLWCNKCCKNTLAHVYTCHLFIATFISKLLNEREWTIKKVFVSSSESVYQFHILALSFQPIVVSISVFLNNLNS